MRKEEKGFTLVETMVALVIISVAVSALGTLLVSSIKTNRDSEGRMDSAAIAYNILSNYSAQIYAGAPVPGNAAGLAYTGGITYDLYTQAVTKTGPSQEVILRVILHHPGMKRPFSSQMVVMAP